MRIEKNCYLGKLKEPLSSLLCVHVLTPHNKNQVTVGLIQPQEMETLHTLRVEESGPPKFATLIGKDHDIISVFPKADRRYTLKITGTQLVTF